MRNEELKMQILKDRNDNIEKLINCFAENQNLSMIGRLRNLGVGLKILENNKWVTLHEYELPFDRFIILYDDNYNISDIGIY